MGGVWEEENSSRVNRSKRRLGIRYMLINEENNYGVLYEKLRIFGWI